MAFFAAIMAVPLEEHNNGGYRGGGQEVSFCELTKEMHCRCSSVKSIGSWK